jgi:hypothetical protein
MLCGTPSGGASTSLSIHFERPVRPYLSRPGRKQVIEVPSSASLDNLRAALAPRLTVDPALFRLFHGKREIASDADLRQLLSIAAERSVEPQLRVAEPEDVILPPVDAETGAPPPPGMPTETLQMISFFAFHPTAASTEEVEALVHRLDELLVQLGALGTIYVACEGVNAQLAVAPSQGTWVVTSYSVAEAISVPLAGWLALRFGVVRWFSISLFGFGLFSLLCGLSQSLESLVFFRIAQGFAGGPIMPLSQALLQQIFPKEKQGAAIGLWALRRYLRLLTSAEAVANQADCPSCGTYGRLDLVEANATGDEVAVSCRKCSHGWRISS